MYQGTREVDQMRRWARMSLKMSTIAAVLMAMSALSGAGLATLAQSSSPEPKPSAVTTADAPESVASPPPIEVAVDCYSSPEVVAITNNRARPVVVKRVGST